MSKLRVFEGNFPTFANFLTPKGDPVTFYKNFTSTTDDEVAEYILTLKGVKEVKVTPELQVPMPPQRTRSRNWASSAESTEARTTISHMEMLTRAVANSKSTPQAADSISLASGGTGTPAATAQQAQQTGATPRFVLNQK